jgi:hypothetical protein
MSSKCDIPAKRRERIDVAFDDQEQDSYRRFLTSTGRKAGPWVRTLILAAIANETGRDPARETKAVGE